MSWLVQIVLLGLSAETDGVRGVVADGDDLSGLAVVHRRVERKDQQRYDHDRDRERAGKPLFYALPQRVQHDRNIDRRQHRARREREEAGDIHEKKPFFRRQSLAERKPLQPAEHEKIKEFYIEIRRREIDAEQYDRIRHARKAAAAKETALGVV